MVQPKMPNQNWESRFKIEFPEIDGSLDHEDFMDWLNQVEEIVAYYDILESKKVKLLVLGSKDLGSYVFRTLMCIVGKS